MKILSAIFLCIAISCAAVFAQENQPAKPARNKEFQMLELKSSPELQTLLDKAVSETIIAFRRKF